MSKDWQRGYDLAVLKSFASVFATAHKPLVHGAFGLTKERDIADALAGESLLFKRELGTNRPIACAIVRRLKTAGHITDVAGREITIPPGHARVSAIAALSADAGAALLAHLIKVQGSYLWVEAFEEDVVMRAALGRRPELRWIATRIAAGSEVKGFYTGAAVPGLATLHPAEAASLVVIDPEFIDEGERLAMLEEISAYAAAIERAPWAQHYSTYNKRHSWTAFALRGFDRDDPGFIIKPHEMNQQWKADNPTRLLAFPEWTIAAPEFPATMDVVRRIMAGREVDRVRLMKLAPGGELSRHADITDRDAGLADGRLARLHLPLRTSPKVIMYGWTKRGEQIVARFPERALCYLDQRGPHRVENLDPKCERVHLVLDVHTDARLRHDIANAMIAEAMGRQEIESADGHAALA